MMDSHRPARAPRAALAAGIAAAALAAPAAAEQPGIEGPKGPSTSTSPYVLPVAPGVRTTSLLTVGDKVGPLEDKYTMVGIPDGLGVYRTDGGGLKLLMNHELNPSQGIPRRHGQRGAFVSEWSIDRDSLRVEAGRDLIEPGGTPFYDYTTGSYLATATAPFGTPFDRFCSNTLTDSGQLFNADSGNGYGGRLFFPNEERDDNSRTFGLTTGGTIKQLPRLGLYASENTAPAHNRTDTTLVFGSEDDENGQLHIYAGHKQSDGSAFDRAGLTDGVPSVVAVPGATDDAGFRAAYGKGTPVRFSLSEIDWRKLGLEQNAEAKAEGLTLNRVEDSHWDPSNPSDLYLVTTEGGVGADTPTGRYGRDGGGLWRLRFDDIEHPEAGGTLTLLLDGSEEPNLNKPDNMTIDRAGNLLIQEDPGNNVHLSRIVAYRIADGAHAVLARFDEDLFGWRGAKHEDGTPVLETDQQTFDEESSGIVDAINAIGPRWFLFTAQVHRGTGVAETVQRGQLLAMHVDNWPEVYADAAP